MNITKITKNGLVILKNKGNSTVYRVNKLDSVVTFEGHDYNINDSATAKNLIYMLIDKSSKDDDLIDAYKIIVKNREEAIEKKDIEIKELRLELIYHKKIFKQRN